MAHNTKVLHGLFEDYGDIIVLFPPETTIEQANSFAERYNKHTPRYSLPATVFSINFADPDEEPYQLWEVTLSFKDGKIDHIPPTIDFSWHWPFENRGFDPQDDVPQLRWQTAARDLTVTFLTISGTDKESVEATVAKYLNEE